MGLLGEWQGKVLCAIMALCTAILGQNQSIQAGFSSFVDVRNPKAIAIGPVKSAYRQRPPNEESGFSEK
jgi:hypothetical protein